MGDGIALALENVRYRYPGAARDVVRGISLEIPARKVTAVLGPNGAGKTTLLHVMLGLLAPEEGLITLDGKPLGGFPGRERSRRVGLVPQFETIPFNFTVLEYVLLGRTPYLEPFQMPGPMDLSVAQGVLKELDLSDLQNQSVNHISGGERQMVMLARVLVQQTRLLLLDEPTAHLDLGNKSRLLGMMKNLSRQGKTVVFTTHDPNVATYIADAVLLMDGGQVVEHGKIEDVFTPDILSAIYRVPVRIERQNGQVVVLMEKTF